jgi:hypothetical protein
MKYFQFLRPEGNWLLAVTISASVPFLSFAAENVGEEFSLISLLLYAASIGITGLLFTVPFATFGKGARSRAGFIVSIFLFMFFSFPVFRYFTGADGKVLYLMAGGFAVTVCAAAWFLSASNLAWRVWITILAVLAIIPSATYVTRLLYLHIGRPRSSIGIGEQFTKRVISAGLLPNVYYLTLDGYPRADSLREFFNFDNSDFIEFLQQNDFLVSDKSYANYMATYLSVAAALEQRFVISESDTNFWDKILWFKDVLNGNNLVFHKLHDLGYFIAKLDFFDECTRAPYVDYCHGNDRQQMRIDLRLTELEFALLRLTPLYDLITTRYATFINQHTPVKNIDNVIEMVKYLNAGTPKFFFSHVLFPHPPYRFNADCSPSNELDAARLGDTPRSRNLFLNQTKCANIKTKEFINFVVKNDPSAIVLLNSDHGSPFVDWSLPYDKWPSSAVRERFGILNAMRLPSKCKSRYYDDISPVNFFELLFACIEGRDPRFLEDRIYISTFDKAHRQYGQVWRYR